MMSIVLNGLTGITAPDIDVTAQTTVADFDAGITLGGSATTLDDYEEGSWTPTLEGTTTNPTVTYGARDARYIKVGNIVHVTCAVFLASVTSSGSGDLRMAGLPFASGDYGSFPLSMAPAEVRNNPTGNFNIAQVNAQGHPTKFIFMDEPDGAIMQCSNIDGDTAWRFSLTYQVGT